MQQFFSGFWPCIEIDCGIGLKPTISSVDQLHHLQLSPLLLLLPTFCFVCIFFWYICKVLRSSHLDRYLLFFKPYFYYIYWCWHHLDMEIKKGKPDRCMDSSSKLLDNSTRGDETRYKQAVLCQCSHMVRTERTYVPSIVLCCCLLTTWVNVVLTEVGTGNPAVIFVQISKTKKIFSITVAAADVPRRSPSWSFAALL